MLPANVIQGSDSGLKSQISSTDAGGCGGRSRGRGASVRRLGSPLADAIRYHAKAMEPIRVIRRRQARESAERARKWHQYRRLAALAFLLALGGCGVGEGLVGVVSGVVVREHETDRLVCATAAIGEAISVSCVEKPGRSIVVWSDSWQNGAPPQPTPAASGAGE